MPITVMLDTNDDTFPEGAYCLTPSEAKRAWSMDAPVQYDTVDGGKRWRSVLVLAATHQGLCIAESEHNMRDDSDFYMTVWCPEKGEPERICFASTRGWTYPCLASHADATPEVLEAYRAWGERRAALEELRRKSDAQRSDELCAGHLGLSVEEYVRLRTALGQRCPVDIFRAENGDFRPPSRYASGSFLRPLAEDFMVVAQLLKQKSFRSSFRASLAERVREWARDANPRYPTPLSSRQLGALRRG